MMRIQPALITVLSLLACCGCGGGKTTDELIGDLKSGKEGDGVIAARTLPMRSDDAAKVVPALIEALNHKSQDVRRSSALKLGQFRELAKDAIPSLQKTERDDADARVREAAGIALTRIDPAQFPSYTFKSKNSKGRPGVVKSKKRGDLK